MNFALQFSFLGILLLMAAIQLGVFVMLTTIFLGQLTGAPFVPSNPERIKKMIEFAGILPGETIIDLGSGNGTILFAASESGARGVGIEINPLLVAYSRWRAKRLGVADRVRFVRADFRRYPLYDADVVFLYLWPSTIAKLREKLTTELKPGARIVSNGFEIPDWTPVMAEQRVFLYHNHRA